MKNHPRIGIGVIIENEDGLILIGKRKNSHAPFYSIPGGALEIGESFEGCAIREIKEETDLDISEPKVITVLNNLETYQKEGIHFISIILHTKKFSGVPTLMEPEKSEQWEWVNPKKLPTPHFEPSKNGVNFFFKK